MIPMSASDLEKDLYGDTAVNRAWYKSVSELEKSICENRSELQFLDAVQGILISLRYTVKTEDLNCVLARIAEKKEKAAKQIKEDESTIHYIKDNLLNLVNNIEEVISGLEEQGDEHT